MGVLGQYDLAGNDVVVKSINVGAQRSQAFPGTPASVTQATNRTTGVTINASSGQITTNTASLAAEASAAFTVTNSFVSANDIIVISQKSGSNGGGTDVTVTGVAAGSFVLNVTNNNVAAGTAETGAIVISFAVIKVMG
jgi:hypothetical protein